MGQLNTKQLQRIPKYRPLNMSLALTVTYKNCPTSVYYLFGILFTKYLPALLKF